MPITPFAQHLFLNRACRVLYEQGLDGGLTVDGRTISDQQVADLASAPNGSTVHVRFSVNEYQQKVVLLEAENTAYLRYSTIREIRVTDDQLVILNDRFNLLECAQGKGIGALALAIQVRACLEVGVVRLDAYAAGVHGAEMTGYFVWPRLGFDAKVPEHVWQKIGARRLAELNLNVTQPAWLSDLLASSEGQELWRSVGGSVLVALLVEEGNEVVKRQLAVLDEWRL